MVCRSSRRASQRQELEILLVEDNTLIGDAIVGQLSASGGHVDWRQSVGEAIAAVNEQSYDCVVLDLRLPDGHGLSVLSHIRERSGITPVLVLSAFDQMTDRFAAMARGANAYLVKPFSLGDLEYRIASLVGDTRRSPLRGANQRD